MSPYHSCPRSSHQQYGPPQTQDVPTDISRVVDLINHGAFSIESQDHKEAISVTTTALAEIKRMLAHPVTATSAPSSCDTACNGRCSSDITGSSPSQASYYHHQADGQGQLDSLTSSTPLRKVGLDTFFKNSTRRETSSEPIAYSLKQGRAIETSGIYQLPAIVACNEAVEGHVQHATFSTDASCQFLSALSAITIFNLALAHHCAALKLSLPCDITSECFSNGSEKKNGQQFGFKNEAKKSVQLSTEGLLESSRMLLNKAAKLYEYTLKLVHQELFKLDHGEYQNQGSTCNGEHDFAPPSSTLFVLAVLNNLSDTQRRLDASFASEKSLQGMLSILMCNIDARQTLGRASTSLNGRRDIQPLDHQRQSAQEEGFPQHNNSDEDGIISLCFSNIFLWLLSPCQNMAAAAA